jgi:gluconokinase
MGVSGAGKTLIGRALARRLGWPLLDADDFHPASNVDKMRGGTPLEPEDRVAWLDAIRVALTTVQRTGGHAVLACSALRHEFREALREGLSKVRFVYLKADRELIHGRVSARSDHFMPTALVGSQFATLDEPDDALVIDASKAPEAIVEEIVRGLPLD